MKQLGAFLMLLVVLVGCTSKSFDTKEAMLEYLRDPENHYLQQKKVNGYEFSLLYKPTDLLVNQELSASATEDEIRQLRSKYGAFLYFALSISKNDQELLSTTPKNRQEFGAMVNRLAFGMGSKVHLLTSKKDTIPLLDYVYPRMYGMSRSTSMLFVYPRDKKIKDSESLTITVGDLGTYTGEVKFKIATKTIKNEPTITFQ